MLEAAGRKKTNPKPTSRPVPTPVPPETRDGHQQRENQQIGPVVLHEATRLHREQIDGRFRFSVTGPEALKDSTRAALVAALKTINP